MTERRERLLTPEEVAEILRLRRPETVREWLRDGLLPGVRVGRLWRVDSKALDEWIEAGGMEEES